VGSGCPERTGEDKEFSKRQRAITVFDETVGGVGDPHAADFFGARDGRGREVRRQKAIAGMGFGNGCVRQGWLEAGQRTEANWDSV